jgi:hypothetical protein
MPHDPLDFISGTFTGVANSANLPIKGRFNLSLSGFGDATIQIRRSFDNGTTWFVIKEYTADISEIGLEPEVNVIYSLRASVHTSGTITFRLAQGDRGA